jgi:hypothetical protein
MISELDTVVLTRSIPEHSLEADDVGAVVHVYSGGGAYEVEFVTAAGETVAVLTLTNADVRPMKAREILHTRLLPAT